MPRLGEILLAAKALTEKELNSALENHVMHGIKLGTCLVEMGYVTDDVLARCLGKQTGQAFLTKDELVAAGSRNLSSLSPAMTKKQRLIPVGISSSKLLIATDNVISAKKLVELEQFIGRKIELVAVSGYAVDCFLEQMFGIQRPGRFLTQFSKLQPPVESPPVVESVKREEAPVVIDGMEWKSLGEVTQDEDSARIYDEIINETQKFEKSLITLSDAAEQLNRANSRDDVAKTVLDFVSNSSGTAALVILKEGVVHGWKAISDKKKISNFEMFSVPADTLPDLLQCVTMEKPCLGRSMTPQSEHFWNTLRYTGAVAAYFPIFIQKKIVAVLICDNSDKLNPQIIAELCRKASYALEILILRSKLLG